MAAAAIAPGAAMGPVPVDPEATKRGCTSDADVAAAGPGPACPDAASAGSSAAAHGAAEAAPEPDPAAAAAAVASQGLAVLPAGGAGGAIS